jgi:D-sedoheptulose 7-phosphate isomerase
MNDPRDQNERFDASSMTSFLQGYRTRLLNGLEEVDAEKLAQAACVIEQAGVSGAHVFAIGNGGSAAIVDHLCCDWTKGTDAAPNRPIAATSLTANMPLYSAIANDFGFKEVFSRQLHYYAKSGDVLIAVSSSGNSENILLAVEKAKLLGMKIISMTGFTGGRLHMVADIALHVPISNYGIVEDVHQALMHIIAQFVTSRRIGEVSACTTS